MQKPTIITEWSFPALDSGLPCTKGAGQRFHTQAERSRATDIYARTLLSMPFMIGYDYFMWVDEPALGISTPFPENTNYGMINEDGVPYPGMVKVFKAIQNTPAKARMQPCAHHRTADDGQVSSSGHFKTTRASQPRTQP